MLIKIVGGDPRPQNFSSMLIKIELKFNDRRGGLRTPDPKTLVQCLLRLYFSTMNETIECRFGLKPSTVKKKGQHCYKNALTN